MRSVRAFLALASTILFVPGLAHGATITVINNDGPGEGFNDPAPRSPVPGNPGTTLGAQRLNVFNAAAAVWAEALRSNITIQVSSQFNPLTCTPTGAVLGSAGPQTVHANFAGAPVANTWYVQALANSRANTDLSGNPDISAQFNSTLDLGGPGCLGGTVWWYGIGAPPVAGTIDLFTTVLHEIGHGLGFLSLHDLGSGAKYMGMDDAFLRRLFDETIGMSWSNMTNPQRQASQVNTGNLTWSGPNANSFVSAFSAGVNNGHLQMYAPNPVQPGSSVSHWDTALTPNEVMEPILTSTAQDYVTYPAMVDIGWVLHRIFKDGFQSGDTDFWSSAIP